MNYLYFSEGTVDGTGDQACYPASAYLGIDCTSVNSSTVFFASINGTGENDAITVTHGTQKHFEFQELMATLLSGKGRSRNYGTGKTTPTGNKGCPNFIVIADEKRGVYADTGNGAGVTGSVVVTIDS